MRLWQKSRSRKAHNALALLRICRLFSAPMCDIVRALDDISKRVRGDGGKRGFGYPAVQHQRATLSRVAALELIPMLLQDDTYQLTARPDPSLGKELLKSGLDGAFGDSYPRCNFLVRKTLEDK